MLKKSASGVLASLRGSTLKRAFRRPETPEGLIRSPRSILGANGPTKCGTYRLASSLTAALPAEGRVLARRGSAGENRGLFEHPEIFCHRRLLEGSNGILCINRAFQHPARQGATAAFPPQYSASRLLTNRWFQKTSAPVQTSVVCRLVVLCGQYCSGPLLPSFTAPLFIVGAAH